MGNGTREAVLTAAAGYFKTILVDRSGGIDRRTETEFGGGYLWRKVGAQSIGCGWGAGCVEIHAIDVPGCQGDGC